MTRKDYIAIAASLRQARIDIHDDLGEYYEPMAVLDRLESAWIDLFTKDNPRFNVEKFRAATKV